MDFDLYVAQPKSVTKKLPAIFVAPAWDGLNAPIETIAQRVAQLGYVAVAVDVYGQGIRGETMGDNSHLMNPLLQDRGILRDRLQAGYGAIREIEAVDATRIGAIGYCFGGLCALDLARAVPAYLKGVVSFHGGLTGSNLKDTKPIEASILIEHGWDDPLVPTDDYWAFANEMDNREADWQAHIHGGAVHAFTFEGANMPENGIQYHEAAARRSWKSMTDFFDEVL
ncbi:dienelactone hydrolase family protein [Leptolyngbya cf. ectocarpi LEGE 11479]|uniref:Dienelactone hydrolase family protein n=1 Tax=Leptolyngbya cf. ectocarpi LEGE 11479 TaxID=1828722 RepID=A0A929F601_LEPEC|nr:dienelactone hydrolase family protein [Leptolyngbya ectocarpi]MBE9067371.1 dienelactone hydrolase family protein [Leptolyngbya cf. ectocarpi LEGE 11479]